MYICMLLQQSLDDDSIEYGMGYTVRYIIRTVEGRTHSGTHGFGAAAPVRRIVAPYRHYPRTGYVLNEP
jgi:hypothetical protein